MKKVVTTSVMCLSLAVLGYAQESSQLKEIKGDNIVKKVEKEKQAKVQIAILLDSSTSMNGLINQARTQLWDVVNTFIDAKVGGKVPFVEVALYTHGQGPSGEHGDNIRQIQPLTRDLDKISQELFALSTTGSRELCGTAITRATKELKWDDNPNTYKAIFIAGNESFKQGSVEPNAACKAAIAKGIIVNTIYCGNETEGINGGWAEGAKLADGTFSFINQNQTMVQIEAPQDAKIIELNKKLNETYVTFNEKGNKRKEMQKAADEDNLGLSKNAGVQRAVSKASSNYYNASWDLLDACEAKDFDWESLKEDELPKELKGKTAEERKAWVAKKKEQRQEIQKEIAKLGNERSKYVATKRKELAKENGDALDTVMQRTVVEQAKKKGYTFEKK